jgi:ketosteroid isomerase-like protein
MTHPDRNVQTIQALYAAFGKGDVPSILTLITEDGEFSFAGASPAVPWHGPWRGSAGISRFFTAIAEGVEFRAFEPLAFTSGGDSVAVRLRLAYRVRGSGRLVDEHQVHWWTLRDGKVCSLVHFEDTAQVIAAV